VTDPKAFFARWTPKIFPSFGKGPRSLIPIKRSFPEEVSAVIAFTDSIKYQEMIDAVTAVRTLGPKVEAFEVRNTIGQRERTKVLFPSLVISEWLKEPRSWKAEEEKKARDARFHVERDFAHGCADRAPLLSRQKL